MYRTFNGKSLSWKKKPRIFLTWQPCSVLKGLPSTPSSLVRALPDLNCRCLWLEGGRMRNGGSICMVMQRRGEWLPWAVFLSFSLSFTPLHQTGQESLSRATLLGGLVHSTTALHEERGEGNRRYSTVDSTYEKAILKNCFLNKKSKHIAYNKVTILHIIK